MRVLVTGGSGFIGRNLIERLGERHELLAPTHAELELTDAAAVAAYLRRHPVDVVVHAAVRPGHRAAVDPSRQLEVNLRMFFNLVACRHAWDRMIYLSSGAVYDVGHDIVRAREEDFAARVPADEHGFSRLVLARYVEAAEGILELRPFGVFGKHEDYSIRFISNAICKTLCDLPVTLRQDRTFSYVWVNDLVDVIDFFLDARQVRGAFNVAPTQAVHLRELADLVVRVSGKELPVVVGAAGEGLQYTADNSRLLAVMPRFEFTPVEQAVRELYDWYASHRDRIVRERLLVDT